MVRGSSNPDGALALGVGLGALLFFKGFRTFREYRLVADTPEISIRSVPMGLVKIHGRAAAGQTIASPLSHTPCYFYKVRIERWESGRNGGWKPHCVDLNGVPLYLEDASGRVQVDARLADLELPETATGITDSHRPDENNAELLQYVSAAQMSSMTNYLDAKLEKHGPLDDPRKEQARSAVLEGLSAFRAAAHGDKSQMGQAMEHILEASGPLPDPQKEQRRQAMLGMVEQMAAAGGPPIPTPGAASGRFRLTEYCILPGQDYEVTGTCMANPHPQDEHDRNLITRGQNEPTFLISYKQERKIESNLRCRAFLHVVGGAALTLVCLALLLARYHLF